VNDKYPEPVMKGDIITSAAINADELRNMINVPRFK